jgi:hypothetical protein
VSPTRWPALVLIPAAIAGGLMIQADEAPPDEEPTEARTLEEQGLMPVAAPADALGSTWHCAGGTASDGGFADHTLLAVNPSDEDLTGTITVYEVGVTDTTVSPLELPAHSQTAVRLADLEGVDAEFAAALVEFDGGEATVEHQVEGENGIDVSPCASTASSSWYFASGVTTRDASETLVFFNPFPDDAVVDVSFRTEQDLRTPNEFEGLVIPGQSVLARDIGEVVTRREHVSTSIVARTGRLVVDRIQTFDGSEGRRGLTVSLGAPAPTGAWFFPDGVVGEGINERFVVYNPTNERAEVDVEIQVDDVTVTGEVEPFELTVPPEGFETVNLNEEARITSARGGQGAFVHGAVVRSANGVPIVAEREVDGIEETDRAGVDISSGSPLLFDAAVAAGDADSSAEETLVIQNPVSDAEASVTVQVIEGGELVDADLGEIPVPGFGRAVVELDGLSGTPLVVSADRPVVVERRFQFDGDIAGSIVVPAAGSLSEPPD